MNGARIPQNARATCETVDDLPPQLRALVHEYGFSVVNEFTSCGVTDPRKISHLVNAVWKGAREPGNKQPTRHHGQATHSMLDTLLASGFIRSAAALFEVLRRDSLVIVHTEPTNSMVVASIEETGKLGLVSKYEKHQARLAAAIRAGALRMPQWRNET